jgi:predicted amidohydrolase YtcJ
VINGETTHADLVLTGGKVITLDPQSRIARAVAVKGDKILAVGSDAEIASLAGPRTRRVDLAVQAVIPGLIDTHAHMDIEGLKYIYPSLAGARSIDDVLQLIEPHVRAAKPGDWITTMPLGTPPNYDDAPVNLRERRFPNRWELDKIAPNNPVYIRPIFGYWRGLEGFTLDSAANSAALKLAGITRDTIAPWDGITIERDGSGEPNGIFHEKTLMSVVELTLMAVAPRFSDAVKTDALRKSMQVYAGLGTTSVYETHGVSAEIMRAYKAIEDAEGLTVRANLVVSPAWRTLGETNVGAKLRDFMSWAAGRGVGNDWLRIAGVFAREGGSADNEIRIGAMPYTNWGGFSPDSLLPLDAVRELVFEAARLGIRVATYSAEHLKLFEEVNRKHPITGQRWFAAHVGLFTGDDIRRMRDLGMVGGAHSNRWIADQGSKLKQRLGPQRENDIMPLRSMMDAGVKFGLETDNCPPSLFHPIWHCIARRHPATGDIVAPSQRLSREEALRAATIDGAYCTFDEDAKGTIEPGKLADLAVLTADPLTVDEDRLMEVTADLTVVGGRIVHQSGRFASL